MLDLDAKLLELEALGEPLKTKFDFDLFQRATLLHWELLLGNTITFDHTNLRFEDPDRITERGAAGERRELKRIYAILPELVKRAVTEDRFVETELARNAASTSFALLGGYKIVLVGHYDDSENVCYVTDRETAEMPGIHLPEFQSGAAHHEFTHMLLDGRRKEVLSGNANYIVDIKAEEEFCYQVESSFVEWALGLIAITDPLKLDISARQGAVQPALANLLDRGAIAAATERIVQTYVARYSNPTR